MPGKKDSLSRRHFLKTGAAIVPLAILGQAIPPGQQASAQQKAPKKQVQYQETPKKGLECVNCLQFVAPDGCKLVEGKINPHGWCLLFAAKPKK